VEQKLAQKDLFCAVVLQRRNRLFLSSYANIHDSAPEQDGFDWLIHSAVGKDWKLQIQVTSSLMEL